MSEATPRLFLLRHGEVASHHGDVPITADAVDVARAVGRRLGARFEKLRVLSGETLRARQTAEAIAAGAADAGSSIDGPHVAFALRNPDLYVAGQRVDMVSSAEALAAQLDGVSEAQAAENSFFAEFFTSPDRIGWWLTHPSPPGDDGATVARRINAFAASLADAASDDSRVVVAVTHSPILRSVALPLLGHDPGEPSWVSGLSAEITPQGEVAWTWLDAAP